ncbi:hypothetical protein [Synechocystis sp. LKSZ1]|uniref:hypothetical protein n=1 Tax=Synechocystis sp. LKSZ1 TaxID=3144951 RepID=UPI00336BBFEA
MQILLFLSALLIAWLLFTWLWKVFKISLKTALTIAVIAFILQFAFGISPEKLWQEIINLPQLFLGKSSR